MDPAKRQQSDAVDVVLFDIDGTLLDLRGAGRRAFALALRAAFEHHAPIDYINFAGNTDLNVLRQIAERTGMTLTDDRIQAFIARMPIELEACCLEAEAILHPGVKALLQRLSSDPRYLLGLVTGNLEACARIKLRLLDLHGHFILGGFGDHHADRAEIARLALDRAQRYLECKGLRTGRVALIGDTPYDIAAAHAVGARALAVATGHFGANALLEAGADAVFNDLSDTEAVLKAL